MQSTTNIVYNLYTENAANLPELVARYFSGATLYPAADKRALRRQWDVIGEL